MYESHARIRMNDIERELREQGLGSSRPRLDRPDYHRDRSSLRRLLRRIVGARPAEPSGLAADKVILRLAQPDDGRLVRLARLDERRAPKGTAVVAELDDQIVAAVPLEEGPVVVDPLRPVGDLVELLELRRRQVRQGRRARG